VVCKPHGLCALQVRVAWDQNIGLAFRALYEHSSQFEQGGA
jgi:hypothetical protein